ncbi:MAG: hypothetical protein H0W61_07765 [Bacteroidetes bacterium]|nr:hypothetical protein [Bacteroidota bacterium]
MKNACLILILLLTGFACTKKKIPQDDSLLGLAYYPTTTGKFVIYDVDSTVYNNFPTVTIKNTKYRIKEKMADNFTDNEGKPAIRLERYIKKFNPLKSYDSIPWTIKEVWMVNADKRSIQVSESNVRYTKLIFPVQQNVSWNGNARNTLGEWLYTYDYIDKKETINGNILEKVLSVKQKQFRTFISYENYLEKYAKGVGLVYREITDIYSNNVVQGVPVEGRIETGVIYKQTLVTYGYE